MQVMVGAYGSGGAGGRGALLPAPPGGAGVGAGGAGKAVIARAPSRNNGAAKEEGPAITVFVGNIAGRAPDAMIRALLAACGPVLSWKRVSTFGFCEFASPEAALRCVRLLSGRRLAERALLVRTDGKMQALVDTYTTEQRSRLVGLEGDAADARQRHLDEQAERRLHQIMHDYQEEINNYDIIQKGKLVTYYYIAPSERTYRLLVYSTYHRLSCMSSCFVSVAEEQISKTARVLEEADISEEKRDVIHREIGKFRESMKVTPPPSRPYHLPLPTYLPTSST